MSSRNILVDAREYIPGTSAKWGRYFSLVSSGTNQTKGKPLEPHDYTLTLSDRFDGYYKVEKDCAGLEGSNSGIVIAATPSRPWGYSDNAKLYGKLEEMYDLSDFNAGIFAGELGKTTDLLADRARQLAKALLAAKNGRFAQAAAALGVGGSRKVSPSTSKRHRDDAGPQDPQRISDGWLELQYGWKPLLADVYDLADTIAKADKPRMKRIVARHSIPWIPTISVPSHFYVNGYGRMSKQIVAYVSEDRPSWPVALGLTDPLSIGWELTPFSFVVDWFMPVGDWLKMRSFAYRAKGVFVTTTTEKYDVRIGATKTYTCPLGNEFKVKLVAPGRSRYVKMSRVVSTSLPQAPLPTFSNGLGVGNRLANAVALLAGIFSGR